MQLPLALRAGDDVRALGLLQCYYGVGTHLHHQRFTGAWFDTWDSTGTRKEDCDHFTADDLVAVTFLSVTISAKAARQLLVVKSEMFSALLKELGPDRDLFTETSAWSDDWAGWRLWKELIALEGVGPTKASKLLARKRPRLRPIYDSVVADVLKTTRLWEPLRAAMQHDLELHPRLEHLREQLDLPLQVSPLRIFDVIAWMEGTYALTCPMPAVALSKP